MAGLTKNALASLAEETTALVEGLRRSVVVVRSGNGHGSGVIWESGGLIVFVMPCAVASDETAIAAATAVKVAKRLPTVIGVLLSTNSSTSLSPCRPSENAGPNLDVV